MAFDIVILYVCLNSSYNLVVIPFASIQSRSWYTFLLFVQFDIFPHNNYLTWLHAPQKTTIPTTTIEIFRFDWRQQLKCKLKSRNLIELFLTTTRIFGVNLPIIFYLIFCFQNSLKSLTKIDKKIILGAVWRTTWKCMFNVIPNQLLRISILDFNYFSQFEVVFNLKQSFWQLIYLIYNYQHLYFATHIK